MTSPTFGFLGPPGTFTQEALLQVVDPESAELIYYPSVEEVIDAVERREVEQGMVPIENSVEGTVNATIDALGFETDGLYIQREVILPVRLHLLGRPGTTLAQITEVYSMPHATAQCRKWLRTHLPKATIIAANSTAEAAGRVAYEKGTAAAIGPNLAAQLFALEVIERDVTDHPEAETRFVVVGRDPAGPSGRDKTSLVVFIAQDRPGALLEILTEFANRSINLTKLESRPTKRVLGEYCFFIDLEGHLADAIVAEAVSILEPKVAKLKSLGSYPRAVGRLDAERLARRARSAKARAGTE
ncbi:MAG: prephenate dehydratase [Actinomycetota bacterium]